MAEILVKDQIGKLVELQKIDGEIYELKTQLKEKPVIIENLKAEFEESKAKLNELEEGLKTIQVRRKEHELNLQTKEEEITKHNAQLSQLKTNKEYSAKISEIESVKADKSIFEEKILLSFDEGEAQNVEIGKEKSNVAEREKVYLARKKEIDDEIRVIEDRVKVLEAQRQQAIVDIDKTYLDRYERVLQHKGGLAIVSVSGATCGGCYMNITTQMINVLKLQDELVECEKCSRILYFEEDL